MSVLTFTEFIAAHTTRNGKTAPPKVKDVAGTEYAVGKEVNLPLQLHQPYECIVNVKQNGSYTNYYLDSATPLGSPAPSDIHGVASPNQARTAANPPPIFDVQRLIVRQSCLKAAVDLFPGGSGEEVMLLAEKFVAWVFESNRTAGAARRPEAQVIGPAADDDLAWVDREMAGR